MEVLERGGFPIPIGNLYGLVNSTYINGSLGVQCWKVSCAWPRFVEGFLVWMVCRIEQRQMTWRFERVKRSLDILITLTMY